jgi:DNA primase
MAGRIPDAFIHDLLARTDIVQVIGERLQLRKAGKEYVALSPFSNEKTPSFTVSPQKQFYHCFSSGKHGSAITFLMEYDRLPFVEAVEDLARRAGLQVPREGGAPAAPVLDGPLDALALAERVYKAELRKSTVAIEYLKQRGITGETAKAFSIGFAPEAWDTLARQFPDPQHAIAAGLLVKNDQGRIYDFYRNRVMFPVRDTRGRIITFGGRVMPGSDDPRKYLNGRETALFNKSRNLYGLHEVIEAHRGGELPHVLVVEGYMDCVMLHQHGLRNAVATLGTATTRDHVKMIFKHTPRIVFCFDGDRAGRAAAWRALEQVMPEVDEAHECRFMFLPQGQDPDTHVQAIGAEAFRQQAASAQPLLDFLLGELKRKVDQTPEGRAKLVGSVRPYLRLMRPGMLRGKIVDELALLARWTRNDVEQAISAADAAAARAPAAADGAPPAVSRATLAGPVRRALQVLLEQPALHERVESIDALAASDAAGVELLTEVLRHFRANPDGSVAQLVERWRGTPAGEMLDQLSIAPLELQEGAYEPEFIQQIEGLQERAIHAGLRARVQVIARAAQERALTPAELAEKDAINRKLAGGESV